MAPRIGLVAGEVSGDWLGAGLIQALRRRYPEAEFEGVAGPRMEAAGCLPLASVDELSLFGLGEVLGELPRVLRLRRRLRRHFLARRPDVFIGIDAPSFNLGLERRLRRAGIPVVHYVCPTVWAWREGRVRTLRQAVDLVLSIFPFEEDYLRRHHVPVRFVGHRLADELPMHPEAARARDALGLPRDGRLVALLPGSRQSEVTRLGEPFLATAVWLARRLPDVTFAAPMATPAIRARFEAQRRAVTPGLPIHLIEGRSREVMLAADAALLASGTATLEALLLKTPMVVGYAVSPTSYHIARMLRLVRLTYFSMPNLLAGRRLVPEFLQAQLVPGILGPWLYRLLTSPEARACQIDVFTELHARMRRDADASAAAAVAEVLERAR